MKTHGERGTSEASGPRYGGIWCFLYMFVTPEEYEKWEKDQKREKKKEDQKPEKKKKGRKKRKK